MKHELIILAINGIVNEHILKTIDDLSSCIVDVGGASATNRVLNDPTDIEYMDAAIFDPYPFGPNFNHDDFYLHVYWIFTEDETKGREEEGYPWHKSYSQISIDSSYGDWIGEPQTVLNKLIKAMAYEA